MELLMFLFSRYSCYHRYNRSNTKSQKNAGCKAPIFLSVSSCVLLLAAGIILS